MIFNDIILRKKCDLEEMKRRFPMHRLKDAVEKHPLSGRRSLLKALTGSRDLNLICEMKKASPSEGVLREDFQPLRIAGLFEFAGARAISILTEPHYFKGRPSYLKTVRQVTKLPILRKDFILEDYQIYESALLEADAVLLIAGILTPEELSRLIRQGRALGIEALVEIHTDEDLKKAADAGAEILGINNRNLRTLSVDPRRAVHMLPHVPRGIPVVVESGLTTHEELMGYKSLGVNNFLIGTVLMKSNDIVGCIHNLLGKSAKHLKTG